jgi:predicted amidohydrolase
MLVLSQERWSTQRASHEIEPVIRAALAEIPVPGDAVVLLLPLGESSGKSFVDEPEVVAALASLASRHQIYVAAAAPVVAAHSGLVQTIGWIVCPDGSTGLRTAKVSPDYIDGFSDTASERGRRFDPPVLETAAGRLGMLINEDVLSPHYARLLTYAGAEVILNPAREHSDYMFESRQRARATRGYENSAYIAVATPTAVERGGHVVKLPTATALYCFDSQNFEAVRGDETLLIPSFDIQLIRRKRLSPFMNQPVYLRTSLYEPAYRREVDSLGPPKPSPRTRIEWVAEARDRIRAQMTRASGHAKRTEQYEAILVQGEFRVIQMTSPDPQAILKRNLDEALGLAARTASNPNVKLVCFSEFFMTGSGGAGQRTPATLERIAITYPGPELDVLSEFAVKHGVYVAGSSFEKDPRFPGRVFNSAFILDDAGKLIHRYRKIHCADIWGALPDCTPGSIFTEYVDKCGYEALFPVADTPIGRLGTIVCFDHTVPETSRLIAKLGAEVIIHCTSDPHGAGRRAWEECRMTRAFENQAYVLAPRPGGEYFDPEATHPGTFLRGYTRIIGPDGRLLGEADTSGKVAFSTQIDLAELARHRLNFAANSLVWDDAREYAHAYAAGHGLPADLWKGDPMVNPYTGFRQMLAVLERYQKSGLYVKPDGQPIVNRLADPNVKMDSEFVPM